MRALQKINRIKHYRIALRLCLTLIISSILATAHAADAQPDEDEKAAIREHLKKAIDDIDTFQDKFDAEVWLFVQSKKLERYIKSPEERLDLLKAIHREATSASLDPDLVLSVIQIESAFDQYAVSRVGAQGLMQVMPFWRKEIGRDSDNLTDRLTNLKYGCHILQYYINIEKNKGGLDMALARYNGSYPRRVYTDKVLKAYNDRWGTDIKPTTVNK